MKLNDVLPIDRKLVGLDLETTGRNPANARIVEISVEVFDVGGGTREWTQRINPGVPIPADASEVHGIYDKDVAESPRFKAIAPRLFEALQDCDLTGYSIRYDRQVLAAEFAREGIEWEGDDCRFVDGLRLWQHVNPRSLDDADAEWLTPEDRAELGEGVSHSASFDIKRSTRVVANQLLRHPKVPRTVQEIHDLLNPGYYDADGKLVSLPDGRLMLTFGKEKDKTLDAVPRDYIQWIVNRGNFGRKVKDACRAELTRRVRR